MDAIAASTPVPLRIASKSLEIPEFSLDMDGWARDSSERTILVGPPGCGKTYALTNSWLVPAVIDNAAVLACSFTKAAAREMASRLSKMTSLPEQRVHDICRTIHSESFRLLRSRGRVILWEEDKRKSRDLVETDDGPEDWTSLCDLSVEATEEGLQLWSQARNRFWPDARHDEVGALMTRLYWDLVVKPRTPLEEMIAEVRHYEEQKRAVGAFDYVDLLAAALRIPAPRRDLLLVDEAQDLFPLQIALVEKWSAAATRTVLIGDPDQGIYEFLGANGAYLTDQIRAGVHARRLSQSYRVPQAVHEVARRLILLNDNRVDAPYLPTTDVGAAKIADMHDVMPKLANAIHDGPTNTAFVLARSRRALGRYAKWLTVEGVPYVSERIGSPWQRRVAAAVILAIGDLRATGMVRVGDAIRLAEALAAPKKNAAGPRWFKTTKKTTLTALGAWEPEDAEQRLDVRALTQAGLDVSLLLNDDLDLVTVARMASETMTKNVDLGPLLDIVKRGGLDALRVRPRIELTTYHGSKGREATIVLVDGEMPWPTQQEIAAGDHGIEVERRCMYVALTRAMSIVIYVRPTGRGLAGPIGLVIQ